MDSHPDIIVDKKSDSPDEDKSAHDSKLLIPTLKDFFEKHPLINPKVFLGDAAFDSVNIYEQLLSGDTFGKNKHFSQAYIPLNERSKLKNPDFTINENGIPWCPHDPSLPMKSEGNAIKVKTIDTVTVRIHVQPLPVAEWFTFNRIIITAHTPVQSVVQGSGMIPIKSELP